ncbi:hypothetical protein HL666_02070 [Bradyrhizobium sp. 83002]|uniref:hypothetical protein n=1 Tax=Bradyrhizobium aeschynomenes TaxID=2734909 RepID=UPI001556121C|nr:hypothetical protein [Bradyrhizobium aeschynomenes]NPU09547.1 hypothetical protein [Bradyrhizobium aeschynomenes]NPV20871.1 hypothetical protein [Bradyrhizobium aeschynomenes]
MPAFTFEKLSAPTPRAPASPPVEKPRSALAGLVNRLVEPRLRRAPRDQSDSGAQPNQPKT